MQAVNSADVAVAQFRFLLRLLLIHGRANYLRMAKLVLYSFYKNIVLTLCIFLYLFFSGFSGQSIFESMLYAGYVILYIIIFNMDIL